ncbi:F-box/LRR-repeat protein 12-like isoform X4 [Aethina tumida]|uniref:F-box/LRR-repeat protein 12-like isoform X4 n=1 Tax=Aethina tumida TaxID=116153 RepID=UPI002149125E|nr:F-box/LRR-repeat protein 12-like isoform X4 [Aethina tumida]
MNTRSTRRKLSDESCESPIPTKKPKITCNIDNLPEEILLVIFSHLPKRDLYLNVKEVCTQWARLSNDQSLWKRIFAEDNIPSRMLQDWIRMTPDLRELSLRNRNDINTLTLVISRHCKNLERLCIKSCRGSSKTDIIKSRGLCNTLLPMDNPELQVWYQGPLNQRQINTINQLNAACSY